MAKVTIFNHEISIESLNDLKLDDIFVSLKFNMIKMSILDLIRSYITMENVPNEFLGFILALEAEIKNTDNSKLSEQALLKWFDMLTERIKQKESFYPHWSRSIHNNKISILLSQLKKRVISDHFNSQFKLLVDQVYERLKKQLQLEMIVRSVLQATLMYQNTAILPVHALRLKQLNDMVLHIQTADNPVSALTILYQSIMHIEQHHVSLSFAANCPYYQSKSRLATYLNKASQTISKNMTCYKTRVETCIEQEILHYLSRDLFYHNHRRQAKAVQLLTQLRVDNLSCSSDEILQKKYKMLSTLDEYIRKIDEDFKNTYFFSKYCYTRRSRLALHLESIKSRLIYMKELPAFELECEIKQPVIKHILALINNPQEILDTNIMQEMNTLIQTINDAKTPQAIESILAGHVRSYMQAGDKRFVLAAQLEKALSAWQTAGLLPSTNDYKVFLEKLASNRQEIENQLRTLAGRFRK